MRKITALLTTLILLLTLAACGAPPSTTSPATQQSSPEIASKQSIMFSDPILEAMVRAAMGMLEGDITPADAENVTVLDLSFEWQQFLPGAVPIREIDGLEYFKNLESLDLSFHEITDISPIAGLKKLTMLILSGNPLSDVAPIAGLTSLKVLALSDCAAQDYGWLSKLTGLEYLMLSGSSIADASPIAGLTNLKRLYLEGCELDYAPLADIYPGLEDCDFEILPPPSTLAELGFTFDDNDKLALYQTDKYDIRINYVEWGDPPQQDWKNCIRVVIGSESGYKIDVGFYPEHNAYVVWMIDRNTQKLFTYVYDVAADSFGCERADMEPIVREAFGDAGDTDILRTPISFFDSIIREALGIPLEILCSMPFDENIVLQSPYKKLGFEFLDYKGTYSYFENGLEISIHRPEWDENVEAGQGIDWSMSYFDPDVKGYELLILYFADTNVYFISLVKDGAEVRFNYYPAEDKYDYDPQSIAPYRPVLSEAMGNDFMNVPMDIFQANIQERFGMSIDELYALSKS